MLKFLLQIGVLLSTSWLLAQGNAFWFNNYDQTKNHFSLVRPINHTAITAVDSIPAFIDYSKSEIVSFSFYLNWLYANFTEFGSEIGYYNTNFLNEQPVFTSAELAFYDKSRAYIGLRFSGLAYLVISMFGISPELGYAEQYNDTLMLENRKLLFAFEGGYSIIKRKFINLTPKAGISWNRYRLLNYNTENVPLSQYAQQRELDVRFNQILGTISTTLNINFMGKHNPGEVFVSFGFTLGYCFKLHGEPLIYTVGNIASSSSRINIDPVYFSISVSINVARYFQE